MDALATRSTATLAADLAQLPGVGAETAAAILLYAFERPMLVIDAYLRRLAQRLCGGERMPSDGELGTWIGTEINDVPRLNELHALVVEHGKRVCLKLPRCSDCCVRKYCRSAYPA
jgi:endonuclease-3 related protein